MKKYHVQGVPLNILVDKKGEIVYKDIYPIDSDKLHDFLKNQ